ncbi:hypothetical protein AMECASPLE_004622 [Ameca splendens]|uniref:Uncharacterized protein n=1 Tax=Ameca splendens TaxID=208324 RepID=A0ABV0XBZ2_9TELE
MKRRGAQHSEYEKTQSAAQTETADMKQHRTIYMLEKAAAELTTDEVCHKLNPWNSNIYGPNMQTDKVQ